MVNKTVAPLIVIVGPTASGKTAFAHKLAKRLKTEIICADSRTIYKGMDVGTAKPDKICRSEVRYHLLDVVNPNDKFTVVDFKKRALDAIDLMWSKGKISIMVGGSGLYIDSVVFDYEFGARPDLKLREKLSSMSIEQLQEKCIKDNIAIPQNLKNKRHLIRAIESGGLNKQNREQRRNTIVVGISTTKDKLKERIEQRFEEMLKLGVIEETENLARQYGWNIEPMKANIYRHLKLFLDNQATIEEVKKEVVKADLSLAKKQQTWFKRNNSIAWESVDELEKIIYDFIKNYS